MNNPKMKDNEAWQKKGEQYAIQTVSKHLNDSIRRWRRVATNIESNINEEQSIASIKTQINNMNEGMAENY